MCDTESDPAGRLLTTPDSHVIAPSKQHGATVVPSVPECPPTNPFGTFSDTI